LDGLFGCAGFSMKEDAWYPSYFNFFLEALHKSLFCCQRLLGVAIGCILVVQAVP